MSDRPTEKSLFSLAQIQHLMRVEFNRAQRYGYPIACLLLGIDRLSAVRDMHGYEAKEEVVNAVAELLRAATRGSDFLGRLGDDRLLAVVPHTNVQGLGTMAKRIVEGGRTLRFDGDGRAVSVTLSIGGSYQEAGDGATPFFDALLQTAEDALFDAQNAGGDRVVLQRPGAESGETLA
ncbi:MAG: GGDEF domain-containing protein [Planctomycetota bacterium]